MVNKGVTDKNRCCESICVCVDFNAFKEVAKELAEMDEKNPFPEINTLKNQMLEHVLRSKKYDWVDNYQYSKGIYNPIELTKK